MNSLAHPVSSSEEQKATLLGASDTANDLPLEQDDRWLAVEKIVASQAFHRAAQLRAMLVYIARHTLQNAGKPLHERDIACSVLNRRPSFDPAYDNIVRVQATHLRRKLTEYYAGQGLHDSIVVTIPRVAIYLSSRPRRPFGNRLSPLSRRSPHRSRARSRPYPRVRRCAVFNRSHRSSGSAGNRQCG